MEYLTLIKEIVQSSTPVATNVILAIAIIFMIRFYNNQSALKTLNNEQNSTIEKLQKDLATSEASYKRAVEMLDRERERNAYLQEIEDKVLALTFRALDQEQQYQTAAREKQQSTQKQSSTTKNQQKQKS